MLFANVFLKINEIPSCPIVKFLIVAPLSFSNNAKAFLSDNEIHQSILASVGQLLQPLFTPLGFGSQLGKWGWVFIVSAIVGLIAKENVISTFGVLAACITSAIIDLEVEGADIQAVLAMINVTGISVGGLLAFIVFYSAKNLNII